MILKDTKRYPVSPPIQSKCEKIWTRKIPNTDTFNTMNMFLAGLNGWKTFDTVVRCAIWYHLYNLKDMKKDMEECYF